jgi:hypothetical protein
MAVASVSLGHKVAMGIVATIPPALVAIGVIFGVQFWFPHFGTPITQQALLMTAPPNVRGSMEFNGTVTWRTVDGDKGAEIVGDVAIPVQGTHIVLTFSKNTDETLPASHLIEVATSQLAGSRAGPVAKIGDLVARSSPDTAGTPLVGDVVDVNEHLFWIALSRLSVDRSSNLHLLAASPFFSLPVTYASGQSALVTFEKGSTGFAVFQKVLTEWGP